MAAVLPGLAPQRRDPVIPRCACGCGQDADRGFPGDVWYRTPHVPPTMRKPWEKGYRAPTAEAVPQPSPPVPPAAPAQAPPAPAAPDLFAGRAAP